MVEDIVLENMVTGAVLELSMRSTPYFILDNVDWGEVKSTHHSYKYVNQMGEYVTGTSLETRDIAITGWVIADDPDVLDERKMFLNRFVNPQHKLLLTYDGYKLEVLPDTSIKYSTKESENNDVLCKFVIEGFCPDPLFAQEVDNKIAAANTIPMFHFPLIMSKQPDQPGGIVFGVRQPSLIVAIDNVGAVEVGMRIVFKAIGTIANPSLTNVSTQKFFKVNKTMQAGEEIEVVTIIGSKKIVGKLNGVKSNYFKYRDLDSEWLQLLTGTNLFRYDADQNVSNLEVYIYYNPRYLEVQKCS